MTGFVIYMCVAIFPSLLWIGQLFSYDINRQIFDISLGLCVLSSLCFRGGFSRFHGRIPLEGLLVLNIILIYASVMFFFDFLHSDAYWFNLFMELKPIFYLACAIWLYSIRTGSEIKHFLNSSLLLSCLILIDFILKYIEFNSVSRATFSGEVNYESVLLLISFAIALRNNIALSILFFLAICATMSRTALLVVPLVFYLVKRPNILSLFFVASVVSIPILISTFSRGLALDLESIDRFWMWKSAIDIFLENPHQFLFGFDLSRPLPVDIPEALYGLHEMQISNKGSGGFYAFSFHAFWLRIISTWGFLIVGIIFSIIYFKLYKSKCYLGLPLIVITALCGFTMGVFYVGHLSVVLLIMLMMSLGANKYA